MSGGGSQTSTGTTYSTNLPEYARPYWERLVGRTEAESTKPYQAYPEQRVAQFNPSQQRAASATMGVAPSGYTNVGQVAQDYGQGPRYTPINVSAQKWTDPGVAQSYMDPYARDVTNIAIRDAQTRFDEQAAGARMQAARAGAYGGSRQAIVEAARQRDLDQNLGDMSLKGLQQAWQSGIGAFGADQARDLQAAGMNIGQAQYADQSAAQRAQALAALYGQQQQLGLQGAQAMMGVGNQEQAQAQRELDVGYQDFVNQRDYERQNLAFLNSIIRGMPAQPNQDVTQVNQTNPLSQAAGLGIAGLGLYNTMNRA